LISKANRLQAKANVFGWDQAQRTLQRHKYWWPLEIQPGTRKGREFVGALHFKIGLSPKSDVFYLPDAIRDPDIRTEKC
jgi:hypothetical protein